MQLTDDMILSLIANACGTPRALGGGRVLFEGGLMDSLARTTLFEGLEDLGVEPSPTQLAPDALRSAPAILAAVHAAL